MTSPRRRPRHIFYGIPRVDDDNILHFVGCFEWRNSKPERLDKHKKISRCIINLRIIISRRIQVAGFALLAYIESESLQGFRYDRARAQHRLRDEGR